MNDVLISGPELEAWAGEVLRALGTPDDIAAVVAGHLADANLRGHDSHGVLRLPWYAQAVRDGFLRPAARPATIRESAATAVFDAGRGFGHYSTLVATEWAVATARELGVAAAAVRHSMHIGRLGAYGERAAAAGMVALVTVGMAGRGGWAVPHGAAERFMSTNPWCIAIPAAQGRPFVFDAATTAIAEGKARVARAKGITLQAGAAVDAAGLPTVDPEDLYSGGALSVIGGAVAGHKGFGLSMAAALMGGLAMIDDAEPTTAGTTTSHPEWDARVAGAWISVIDVARFGPPDAFSAGNERVLEAARGLRPAPGFDRVRVAGDPEREVLEQRSAAGIPLPAATVAELTALAESLALRGPAPVR